MAESRILFDFMLLGFYLTAVYDIFRVLRRVFPHSGGWVAAEDIAFWIFCGAKVFLLMYHESNGTLRWFSVAGALAGIWIYHRLLSPVVIKYLSKGLSKAKNVTIKIIRHLFNVK